MKSKTKRIKLNKNASVQLRFENAHARSVCVAGSFNGWRPEATPLEPIGPGRWVGTIALQPGVYEYRLVVDGEWVDDPQAAEHVPNAFGSTNAVLRVNV
jgi:1,4-alpha-glucan branching enzyme